jgi:Metallo-beta-lactamase superfamily
MNRVVFQPWQALGINFRTKDLVAIKRVIKGVHIVPMGLANAFLIEGDDGLALIDAGYPDKESAVFGAIRRLSRSPDQLKHLVLFVSPIWLLRRPQMFENCLPLIPLLLKGDLRSADDKSDQGRIAGSPDVPPYDSGIKSGMLTAKVALRCE